MPSSDAAPSILWSLHRQGKIAACEVILAPHGTDVRIVGYGSASRSFANPEDALNWAEAERDLLVTAGWLAID